MDNVNALNAGKAPLMQHVGGKGHYKRVCISSQTVHEIQEEDDSIFLGTVNTHGDLKLKDRKVPFKMDSGADVM